MRRRRLLLAIIGATVLLGGLTGSASARSLSFSSQTMRATFSTVSFEGPFGTTNCAVTLESSMHTRTIPKLSGWLLGYITRADLGPCSTGTATILRETLPWHMRYESFAGTLPNITSIRAQVVGVSFRVREPNTITCLVRTMAERPSIATFTREAGTSELTTETIGGTIPTDCAGIEGRLRSVAGFITVLNSTARITVTLI
jgi:hypothetical protein